MATVSNDISSYAQFLINPPDITIKIAGYEWRVHQSTLSQQSVFFKGALTGEFIEAKNKVIELHEDPPWIIALFLLWCYRSASDGLDFLISPEQIPNLVAMMKQAKCQGDIGNEVKDEVGSLTCQTWKTFAQIYQTADKYTMRDLSRAAMTKMLFTTNNSMQDLTAAVEYLGHVALEQNHDLRQAYLETIWDASVNAKEMLEKWKAVVSEEESLESYALDFICERSDRHRVTDKENVRTLDEVNKVLKVVASNLEWEGHDAAKKVRQALRVLIIMRAASNEFL